MGSTCCESPGGIINLCAPGSHGNEGNGHCYANPPQPADHGFWCGAAWCSKGSVCCKNGAYGLCGSPGTTCCESPGGIINLCAPGSQCNQHTGNCFVGETDPEEDKEVAGQGGFFC